ncbi:MAG: SDR family NAD(P)-dependent oxidoreductase [Candidatus Humimicrobiaceae bacterium]
MKNVVITGSTRGIGLCMAKEFLRADNNVTISGRGGKLSEELKKELSSYGSQIFYVSCDVSKVNEVERLWRQSKEKWGSIDIWINNAGQNCPYEYCYETKSNYIDALIDTNIKGMIYGSQIASKNMLAQGSGQIWNMEGLGSNGMIQERTILYGTSKRALRYFTKGLARELKGTPVMAGRLSPGMMLTDFITKTPDGEKSPVIENKGFKFVFNALGDRPETVASFFIPRILANTKNDALIAWLTKAKTIWRFIISPLNKNRLI